MYACDRQMDEDVLIKRRFWPITVLSPICLIAGILARLFWQSEWGCKYMVLCK